MRSAAVSRVARPRLETRAWLRTVGRAGPERWAWGVAAVGWVVLSESFWARRIAEQPPVHEHHVGMAMDAAGPSLWSEVAGHLVMWTAMVLATMLPLVAWNLRRVGLRSPPGRRTRATVEVAAGWFAVWLGAGIVLSAAAVAALRIAPTGAVVLTTVAVAVGWQLTAVRRVAVARCHRTFAPPLGPSARWACVRFGTTLGRDCAVSCWAAMALMAAAGHRLWVVLPVAWLSWRDRRRPHDRPGTPTSVVVLVLAGLVCVLFPASWL